MKAVSLRHLYNCSRFDPFLRSNESSPFSVFGNVAAPGFVPAHFKTTVPAAQNPGPEQWPSILPEFLSTECGFSPKEIAQLQPKLSKSQKLQPVEACRQSVELLRRFGFTDSQVRKTLVKYPVVLSFKADERLMPRLEVLRSFGFTESGLGDAVSREPSLLHFKNLVRNIEEFREVFGPEVNLFRIVEKGPWILTWNSAKARESFQALKRLGFQEDFLLRIVSKQPLLLKVPPAEIGFMMDYLKSLGISESSRAFATTFSCIVRGGRDLDKRVEVLSKAGLKDNEIKTIFRKHPYAIVKSPGKLQSVMDYLVNSADLSPQVVTSYPSIFGYSLAKRIIPRHEVFKLLNATSPSIKLRSLGKFISLSETQFFKKYVKDSPYASQIMATYKAASEVS